MGLLVALRFAKLAAVIAFASGTVASFVASDPRERRRAAFGIAAPGFVLAWLCGYVMALQLEISLGRPWIVGAAIASTIAIDVVLWSVARPSRRTLAWAAVAGAALIAALGLMVWRPG